MRAGHPGFSGWRIPEWGGQELGREGTGHRSIARTGIGERPDGSQMEQGGGSEQTVRLRAGMLV